MKKWLKKLTVNKKTIQVKKTLKKRLKERKKNKGGRRKVDGKKNKMQI